MSKRLRDKAVKIDLLLEKVYGILGTEPKWQIDQGENPPESIHLTLDCSKANQILSWHNLINLDLCLDWTTAWYQAYWDNRNMQEVTINQIHQFYEICLP